MRILDSMKQEPKHQNILQVKFFTLTPSTDRNVNQTKNTIKVSGVGLIYGGWWERGPVVESASLEVQERANNKMQIRPRGIVAAILGGQPGTGMRVCNASRAKSLIFET